VVRLAGIVWTQAGSGVICHEIPAETGCELHGLHIFVNLSPENKLVAPELLRLERMLGRATEVGLA
jgi:redox-sensitive bicupin YhaK (pirin superfamily)